MKRIFLLSELPCCFKKTKEEKSVIIVKIISQSNGFISIKHTHSDAANIPVERPKLKFR